MDSVSGYMQSSQAKASADKQKETFKAIVTYMQEQESFTLANYKQMLADLRESSGIDSWRSKMTPADQKAAVEEFFVDLKILESCPEEDLATQGTQLKRSSRTKMAEGAKVSMSQVGQMLKSFEERLRMHQWIHARMKKNLPVPEDQNSFMAMMQSSPMGQASRKAQMKAMGRMRGKPRRV